MTPEYSNVFQVILENQITIMVALQTDSGVAIDARLRTRISFSEGTLRALREEDRGELRAAGNARRR